MIASLFLAFLAFGATAERDCATGGRLLTEPELAHYLQEVERARWSFDLAANQPFEAGHPLSMFTQLAAESTKKICILRTRYGEEVSDADLAREQSRIDVSTMAPQIWIAMKAALNNDDALIREVICRRLVTDRRLRSLVAVDREIQSSPLAKVTEYRQKLLRGEIATGQDAFQHACLGLPVARRRAKPACEKMVGPFAEPAGNAFAAGQRVTPILEDESLYFVARSNRTRTEAEGFVVAKTDYATWVRSARCSVRAGS